ncbi:MAG TPA: tRNA pseudouridine(55) synthase TruB [Chloroflexota bacterium]|nr:tRNA pseudouridine(55) synthase TruB [Chloroflexota bacterium]
MARPSAPHVDGYLNVLKPPGLTSHDVVARVRRLTGAQRVGHTGTLDPSAAGVLPLALGRATRTVDASAWDRKMYWADVLFGLSTTTDDAEGAPLAVGDPSNLEESDIRAALRSFIGQIDQRPPAYSAVHVGGERAYRAARRGLETRLPSRSVVIHAIQVAVWSPPLLSLLVDCGSGTYIRALARDIGEALACPAHLQALVRLRVGPFGIGEATDLASLEALGGGAAWLSLVWPPDIALRETPAVVSPSSRSLDFLYGRRWCAAGAEAGPDRPLPTARDERPISAAPRARIYSVEGDLLGVAVQRDGEEWQPVLSFVRSPAHHLS